MAKRSLTFLLLLSFLLALPASPVWEVEAGYDRLTPSQESYADLYQHTELLYDSTGRLTLNDIRSGQFPFSPNNSSEGYQKTGVYWLKARIKGRDSADGRYLFSIGMKRNTWGHIEVFLPEGDTLNRIETGFNLRPADKAICNLSSYFWVDLAAGEEKTLYARLDPQEGFGSPSFEPDSISLYAFDPSTLHELDGTFYLGRVGSTTDYYYIFPALTFFQDSSCQLKADAVIPSWNSRSNFILPDPQTNCCYWSHINLVNPDSIARPYVLSFPLSWQKVSCYYPGPEGSWEVVEVGNQTEQDAWLLTLTPHDTLPVFFRYPPPGASMFPSLGIHAMEAPVYFEAQKKTKIKFLFIGTLVLPFLFFFTQLIVQKDRLTLYYLIFLLGSTIYLVYLLDTIPYFLFNPRIITSSTGILLSFYGGACVALIGLGKFTQQFLDVRTRSLKLLWLGNIFLLVLGIVAVMAFLPMLFTHDYGLKEGSTLKGWYIFTLQLFRLAALFTFLYIIFLGIQGLIKRIRFSTAYFIAFAPFMLSGTLYVFIHVLMGLELDKNRILNDESLILIVGFMLTLLLFGVVIGVRHHAQNKDKIRLQQEMLSLQEEVNQRLVQVDKLKDQFLANTSHELRTPLQGIIGLSESLVERVSDPYQEEDLNMIISSGKRLNSLVNDILDFSKLKNQGIALRHRSVDLYSLAEVVLRIHQPLVEGKDLQLENKVSQNLKTVHADEDRLQQILFNLVGNAIKFTEKGSVSISAREQGEFLEIEVADTGIGIPKEKHEVIFQDFEQADGSIERSYGGTGLGLSIAKRLVELHQGRIWLESIPGRGTSFFFTLPATSQPANSMDSGASQKLPDKSLQASNPAPKDPGEIPVLESPVLASSPLAGLQQEKGETLPVSSNHPIRILVVDDEPINQLVLKNHLQGQGFLLTQALNGEEAMRILDSDPRFDLVLLDIMMPRMSGYEVCQKIREKYLPSELPVIMVTAKNLVNDLVQGLSLGANDYIPKPFQKEELLARIKTQLDLHRIFNVAGRFVPNEFLHSLQRDRITEVVLGDHVELVVSVLFSDIRDYTSLAETMTPEETFRFVNAFHGRMGPIIQKHKGFVNQYLGDAIMSVFPESPTCALEAAIAMQQTLLTYNESRRSHGRRPISMGIGVHYGPLIMGIIGDEKRMDAASIADTVNTTSRIENLTKHFGVSILLSEDSLQQMEDKGGFHFRYLGKVQVKGKKAPVGIYECFDGDAPEQKALKMDNLAEFDAGLSHYLAKEFVEAAAAFNKVLKKNPEDFPARFFLNRASRYTIDGVPKDWTGVEVMVIK